jgi:probable rRNA maturation factor
VVSLGDIVISLEKAQEQANEYGHSFEREVAFLTVHSMLHLLGYDHMEEDEERDMRARQRAVMELLGLTVASSEE